MGAGMPGRGWRLPTPRARLPWGWGAPGARGATGNEFIPGEMTGPLQAIGGANVGTPIHSDGALLTSSPVGPGTANFGSHWTTAGRKPLKLRYGTGDGSTTAMFRNRRLWVRRLALPTPEDQS